MSLAPPPEGYYPLRPSQERYNFKIRIDWGEGAPSTLEIEALSEKGAIAHIKREWIVDKIVKGITILDKESISPNPFRFIGNWESIPSERIPSFVIDPDGFVPPPEENQIEEVRIDEDAIRGTILGLENADRLRPDFGVDVRIETETSTEDVAEAIQEQVRDSVQRLHNGGQIRVNSVEGDQNDGQIHVDMTYYPHQGVDSINTNVVIDNITVEEEDYDELEDEE